MTIPGVLIRDEVTSEASHCDESGKRSEPVRWKLARQTRHRNSFDELPYDELLLIC